MIAGDVFRGRYYKGWERSEPIPANSVQKYQIAYPANDHTFKKGHRIMVQIQSTWFPVIDRNPQKFVPNIFKATESDFQKGDAANLSLGSKRLLYRLARGLQ